MKRINLAILSIVIFFMLSSVVSANNAEKCSIYFEDNLVKDISIVKKDEVEDIYWLPLRTVFESIGAEVIWLEDTHTILILNKDTYCCFKPNEHSILQTDLNVYFGNELINIASVERFNGVTYVSEYVIRDILEKWEYSVCVNENKIDIQSVKYISGNMFINGKQIEGDDVVKIRNNHGVYGETLISFSSVLKGLNANLIWSEDPGIVNIEFQNKLHVAEFKEHLTIHLNDGENEYFRLSPMGIGGCYVKIDNKLYLGEETAKLLLKQLGCTMFVQDKAVILRSGT